MAQNGTDIINDPARLETLQNTELLDAPSEEVFERLIHLASKALGTPVTLVSLVDEQRQFFTSSQGLGEPWASQRETPLSHSFCQHVVTSGQPLVINDAREHPQVKDNLAIKDLGVVAYAGIPLKTSEGHTLGSFCAIDGQPREWTDEEIDLLQTLTNAAISEIELRLTARRLRASLKKEQEMQKLRDDLAHMIIHDLRTPLQSLMMSLQMLVMEDGFDEDQRELLHIAERGSHSLLKMINTLLDINKIESGSLQLESSQLEAAALCEAATSQVQALADKKKLQLSTEIAPDLPVFQGDKAMLTRTLVNLLGNAIEFTPENGSVVVAATMEPDEPCIRFSVCDTGIGIPEADLERIFEKFAQIRNRRSEREMSTGLGLTFCKLAVEAHGGQIHARNEEDGGSTFFFTLPVS